MKAVMIKDNDTLLNEMKLFTYEETAKILRCSEKTVYNRVQSGEIHPVRNGRLVLFPKESIEDFLKRNQNSPNKRLES